MHRPKYLNNPSDRVVYFSPKEFQTLEELIYERLRLREPRQSTSAGHNVQTASEAIAEQERLATQQSTSAGHNTGSFRVDPRNIEAHAVPTPTETKLRDEVLSIRQRLRVLEDGLSCLSETVRCNKKEVNVHAASATQLEACDQGLSFLEDRLSALSTTVARNKKEWNETRNDFKDRFDEIAQHMNDPDGHRYPKAVFHERIAALETMETQNRGEWKDCDARIDYLSRRIDEFDVNGLEHIPVPASATYVTYVGQLHSRITVLEKQMADMRSALHNAGKV